jgi:DNA-directed RNA polymerase specialized sigma24 family protein
VSKGENADQKPFGSAFWHNGARCTWYAQLANAAAEGEPLHLGLFNRKANLGPLRSALAFTVTFTDDQTTFRRADVSDTPELASLLTVRQRMVAVLRRGAVAPEQIAQEIEAKVETVERTARRCKNLFILLASGKLGLKESRAP